MHSLCHVQYKLTHTLTVQYRSTLHNIPILCRTTIVPSLSSFVNLLWGWHGGTDAAGPCPLLLVGSIEMRSFACLFIYTLLSVLRNILTIILDHLRILYLIVSHRLLSLQETNGPRTPTLAESTKMGWAH